MSGVPCSLDAKILEAFVPIFQKNYFYFKADESVRKDHALFREEDAYRYRFQTENYIKREHIDFMVEIELFEITEKSKKLTFKIKNQNSVVIYEKARSAQYVEYKKIVVDLEEWLNDFFNFIPPVGKITYKKGSKVQLQIFNKPESIDFTGRNYYIGPLDFTNRLGVSDKHAVMGGLAGKIRGNQYNSFLFDKYQKEEGELVVLVPQDDPNSINARKNKGDISKTLFDYQNNFKKPLLHCLLLPIIQKDSKMAGQLMEQLMEKLKEQAICTIKNDQKLTKILEKRKQTLNTELYLKPILKKLSDVTGSGSILRLKIDKLRFAHSIYFDIVSEDGENIYYSNSAIVENLTASYLNEMVLSWVYQFKKNIPYSGKVVHVTNEKLLVEISDALVAGQQQFFEVVRPVSVKFENVNGQSSVSWQVKKIAQGAVTEVQDNYSKAKVFKLYGDIKVRPGDWVVIKMKENLDKHKDEYIMSKHNIKSRRRTGRAFGTVELYQISVEGVSDQIKNITLGMDFYLPRGWLVEIESGRNISSSNFGLSDNQFKVALGYSTSPRSVEWATLIDYYAGYRVINFALSGIDTSGTNGIGDLKFKGIFFGARIEIPVYKDLDITFDASIAPFDTAENSNSTLFGEPGRSYETTLKLEAMYHITRDFGFTLDFYKMNFKTIYDDVPFQTEEVNVDLTSNMFKLGFFKNF